jgi:hypothetical protein
MGRNAKTLVFIAVLSISAMCLVLFHRFKADDRERTVEGIYQSGPEQQAFFIKGDCSKTPWWFTWPDHVDQQTETRIAERERSTWFKVRNVSYSQWIGREE